MLTLLKRWKTDSSLNASRFSETSRTIRPRWRSCSVTCALEPASTSPRDGHAGEVDCAERERAPSTLSSADPAGTCWFGCAHRLGAAEQPLELLGDRGALLGELRA